MLIGVGSLTAVADANAQSSRWRVDPAVGILIDSYDSSLDGNQTGAYATLNVSRAFGSTLRGVASLGTARVSDVAALPPSSPYSVRNDWLFAMAGPALDIAIRRVSLSLAVQAGLAWRRLVNTGERPPAELGIGSSDWSPRGVLAPSGQLSVPITRRFAVTGSAAAYVLNVPESFYRTSPAFAVGIALQP
jgi:hypothetical protein